MTAPETVGYFSGDWEWNADLECFETAYVYVGRSADWNGALAPVVTRDVLRRFAARQEMLDDGGSVLIRPDGNGYMIIQPEDAEPSEWLLPDPQDLFCLRKLGFMFEVVTDDDRVVRRIG